MTQSLQTTTQTRRRGRTAEPLDQRILKMTDRSGECWLWLGSLSRQGYGRITVNKHYTSAHRISYETFVGSVPSGLEIDHLCRVRHCVNPKHLEAVSHTVNMRRSIEATGMIAGKRAGGQELGGLCSRGHLLDEENTYLHRGILCCLTCARERNRLCASGGKPRQRTYTDHAKVAAKARARHGEWIPVLVCGSAATAYHTVHYIRTGKRLAAYQPAGSFQAEHRSMGDSFHIYARFVGTTKGGA